MLYTPSRLSTIASEAAKPDSIFSLADRIGLVHDAFALGKAGYLEFSAALNLAHELRAETECQYLIQRWLLCEANAPGKVLVWESIDSSLAGIIHTWWEDDKVTLPLKAFRRVRWSLHHLA